MRSYLEFEKPVADLEGQIQELRVLAERGEAVDVTEEIGRLETKASQALQEISSVSTNLASLIESISSATQQQAESATRVAQNMQGILRVTEQTTVGTKQTAVSIGQLAELAVELKGSVSGRQLLRDLGGSPTSPCHTESSTASARCTQSFGFAPT